MATSTARCGPPLEQLEIARTQVDKQLAEKERLSGQLTDLSRRMERLRLQGLKLAHKGKGADDPALIDLERRQQIMKTDFNRLLEQQLEQTERLEQVTATVADVSGREKSIPLASFVRVYRPNTLSTMDKTFFYLSKLKELIVGEPREANTEGGLFPAIFGTVMLIFLMSLVTFPARGAGRHLSARICPDGLLVRLVRIAVNNLAGIPPSSTASFGLGFFVYGVGGSIDQLFFPERLPTPTFGTGGILWASLTLALLTVPVVIVATEEALGAIPAGVREGSLSLGATKFQTLMRILLPMASPGIMTGLILAMARAAGEVAPLMITGVVKLAPALPLDGSFPYLHLDRKFMHLGFHIYDIGFQSPNVEAAKPMVFVTTLLLVLIVVS
jgi:phosphate transport system permease protein